MPPSCPVSQIGLGPLIDFRLNLEVAVRILIPPVDELDPSSMEHRGVRAEPALTECRKPEDLCFRRVLRLTYLYLLPHYCRSRSLMVQLHKNQRRAQAVSV